MAEGDSNVFINGINNSIVDNLQAMSNNLESNVAELTVMMKSLVDPSGGLKLSQSSLQDLIASGSLDGRSDNRRSSRRDVFEERRQSSQNSGSNTSGASRFTTRRADASKEQWERDIDDFYRRMSPRKRRGNSFDEIMDGWEDQFRKSLFGSVNPLKDVLTNSVSGLAKRLGVATKDLPRELGSRLGKAMGDRFKNSAIGSKLTAEWNGILGGITNRISGFADRLGNRLGGVDLSQQSSQSSRIFSSDLNQDSVNVESSATSVADEIANEPANVDFQRSTFNLLAQIAGFTGSVNEQNAIPVRITNDSFSGSSGRDLTEGEETSDRVSNLPANLTNLDGDIEDTVNSLDSLNRAQDTAAEVASRGANNLVQAEEVAAAGASQVGDAATTLASTGFPSLTVGILGAVGAFSVLGSAIGVAVGVLKQLADWSIAPIKEGIQGLISLFTKSATKTESRNSRYLQLWRERLESDIKSLREASYSVIKESAQRVTDVWDNVLNTVTATQGYTKAGVQTLWSTYSSRLAEEGLASVVSSADIMEKLESVLESGLSGKVAEEFAYQATLLNSAIPTEDFFQYATTYASIAANAIKAGQSQQEALNTATEELKAFANNLLYASREVAGGFTTSLSNASSLFEQSAKIALTSRVGDVSEISGVLTSVSAIVGATAPDLADSIVTAIVDAATGGNASNLTALRSMAGIGASNTAFLQALANDPKSVFAELFRNLANLQNMSAENYMEVAEGLSEVFGLSMDAFARVDFAYLADAIEAMRADAANTNAALNDNIDLLKSGETTSTAAQMKMQKINEYMIEEGLAYVLDNEAARSIQEHMWEEQMMRDLVDSTFAVDFAGTAYQAIQSIIVGVNRVAKLVSGNLFSDTYDSFKLTALTMATNADEIKEVVAAGVVGKGNQKAFTNLTTGYTDLQLVKRYGELLTGSDNFSERYQLIQDAEDTYRKKNQTWFDKMMSDSGYSDENELLQTIVGQKGRVLSAEVYGDVATGILDQAVDEAFDKIGSDALPTSGEAWLGNLLLGSKKGEIKDYVQATDDAKALRQAAEEEYGKLVAKSSSGISSRTATQADLGSRYSYSMVSKSTAAATQAKSQAAAAYVTSWDPNEALQAVASGEQVTKTIKTVLTDYFNSEARITPERTLRNLRAADGKGYMTQEELIAQVTDIQNKSMETASTSFEGYKQEIEKALNAISPGGTERSIEEILADYGADVSQLQALYNQQEALQASAESKARDLHEVQFWEDMQNFATKDFPDYMEEWAKYRVHWDDSWASYMRNWEAYYIQHTAYGKETAGVYVDEKGNVIKGDTLNEGESIASWKMAQEAGQGDAILALAQTLTDNETYRNKSLQELKDPTLQTNAILSKILLTVEAIFQQNNETSIVSIPTSLSSLGLGVTNM